MKKLVGRVAVITGGASGIGRATADLLARKGCSLALVDVNPERLAEVAEGLMTRGVRVSTHLADVSEASRMEILPAEVVAEHGAVHILVNNAGVSVAGSFEDQTIEDLQWIVGINFWGVVHGCKFFLPELKKADEAHIVNLSSMFGFIGVPSQSSYCATKFAVKGLSESLWLELQGAGIGVTSIHPGGIRTNIAETMRAYDEDVRAATVAGIERSRPPAEVAKVLVRAIEKNRLRAIVGWEAFAADWLKRLLPISTHRLIARRMGKR
ncbi:MAG: acetoin dehydrogenase [Deltaproteobacteria bacterium]|nr:acetoin dehydrogenase [Deltaproteobacteria bacterium]